MQSWTTRCHQNVFQKQNAKRSSKLTQEKKRELVISSEKWQIILAEFWKSLKYEACIIIMCGCASGLDSSSIEVEFSEAFWRFLLIKQWMATYWAAPSEKQKE